MRAPILLPLVFALPLAACGPKLGAEERAQALDAFATVRQVFQHPRCQNCHIPGDAPLQFDAGLVHTQGVVRGPEGRGAPGLPCATCHGTTNPPASYGPHAPPGAPHWQLPPPGQKMVFIDLSPAELCGTIKDKRANGGRSLDDLLTHVREDALVLWGWDPGGERAPVSVPHDEFVAAFERWAAAGGPCPEDRLAAPPVRGRAQVIRAPGRQATRPTRPPVALRSSAAPSRPEAGLGAAAGPGLEGGPRAPPAGGVRSCERHALARRHHPPGLLARVVPRAILDIVLSRTPHYTGWWLGSVPQSDASPPHWRTADDR